MYPDLSYIMHAVFGTQPDNALSIVKTFGLFLILSFIASAVVLYYELRRKGREGLLSPVQENIVVGRPATRSEIGWNALLGFVLGFKISYIAVNFADFQQDAAGVLLSGKGLWLWGFIGAALFGYLKFREYDKRRKPKPTVENIDVWPHQRVGDITIVAAVSGIIGAKLAAMFESGDHLRAFLADPVGQLFSGSGLAIYGGLILAAGVVLWYTRRKGIPSLHLMDAAAPALMVGYAVGRIGCQLSGDGDWGIENTLPPPAWWFFPEWLWAFDYPHNVLNEGIPIDNCTWQYCSRLAVPVFPTPVYETVMAFLTAGVLLWLGRKIRIAGLLFFIYLIFTGIERYLIEKIRVNPDISILGIEASQAEYISALFVLAGIAGCIWRLRLTGNKE